MRISARRCTLYNSAVPIRWIAEPDEAVLDAVATALNDADRSGALLAGPDGVGKTLAARVAAERFAAQRPLTAVRWVTGTPSQRNIPFAAFSRLADPDCQADNGRPAALLRVAHDSLVSSGDDLLLVVDDAHELDSLSARLVYRLARSRSARLIVTVRSGAEPPDAVAALVSDDLLARIDIEAPDTSRTTALLESVLGGPLTQPDDVAARSGGNPLYLRRLVEDGDLLRTEKGWRCRDQKRLTLPDLIDEYLAGLPATVRTTLDYLAVAEPLLRGDLAALAGEPGVDAAETVGVIIADDHDMMRAAHPLYIERARAALPPAEARTLRTSIVGQLSVAGSGNISDRLRLAALAIDCDAPVPDITAARQALRLGELTLAERLALAALEQSGGLAARLPLTYALAWQGRGREAGEVLAAVNPDQLSPSELTTWALARAANQFWMLGEPERAIAFVRSTRDRLSTPAARTTLDALAATFAMNAGTPLSALRTAGEVLASPHAGDVGVGWAASAAALCSARTGRFADVEAFAGRALTGEHPGLLRFTSGFARVTTLLMTGRLDAARSLAQRYTDSVESQQPGTAIGEVLVAYVAIAQGDFDAAVALLEPAAEALARTGYSWGTLSLMLLAQALGQQGDQLAAAKAFSRAESRHGLKSGLFTPELALAKAWSKAARGDETSAIDAAREAVQAAERGGQSAIALRALGDAARLGDIRAVYRAERLSVEVDCVLGRLTLAHARALAAGDVAALADVAADLAEVGLHPAAVDAAAQAAQPVR